MFIHQTIHAFIIILVQIVFMLLNLNDEIHADIFML